MFAIKCSLKNPLNFQRTKNKDDYIDYSKQLLGIRKKNGMRLKKKKKNDELL